MSHLFFEGLRGWTLLESNGLHTAIRLPSLGPLRKYPNSQHISLESWNSKLKRQPIVRSALHMAWISCTAALFGRCSESKSNKSNEVQGKTKQAFTAFTRNLKHEIRDVTKLIRFATTPKFASIAAQGCLWTTLHANCFVWSDRDLSNVFCIFLLCLRLQRTACNITRWHIREFSATISASNTHKWILICRRLWWDEQVGSNFFVLEFRNCRMTELQCLNFSSHLSSDFWVQVRTRLIPCSAMHPEFHKTANSMQPM